MVAGFIECSNDFFVYHEMKNDFFTKRRTILSLNIERVVSEY